MATEADTCRTLITPKLQTAGWENDPHSIAKQRSFTDGRIVVQGTQARRRKGKRADYLLRYNRDFTIAVDATLTHSSACKPRPPPSWTPSPPSFSIAPSKENCDMKPVRLSELIEALEFESDEFGSRVDLQNGSVVRLAHSMISAVEEGDVDALQSMAECEQEEVEIARAVVEEGDRFVAAPSKVGRHAPHHPRPCF